MEELVVLVEQILEEEAVDPILILSLAVLVVLELLLFHMQVHKEVQAAQSHHLAETLYIHLQPQAHIQHKDI
jgi:hypothetical protein